MGQDPKQAAYGGRIDANRNAYLGVPGGNKAQRFVPVIKAFQALVAKGSMWRPLPLRAEPMTNHLCAARLVSITQLSIEQIPNQHSAL
jgi:hypothetical protein